MDYGPLLELPGVTHLFETERGSKYAHHDDSTTTRNRSSANHSDKTEGMQPRSGKTVYMNPTAAQNIAGIFQNSEMGTRLVPMLDTEGKPTGKAALELIEKYGPKEAGTRLGTAPFTTTPAVGMVPVEITNSQSPKGDTGRGIHFGTKITSIRPMGGSGGGGGGGASGSDMSFMKGLGNKPSPTYKTGGSVDKPLEGGWKLI
jgi:hypothetical protein